MKTILITGAEGKIGRVLQSHLGDNYHLRCLDIRQPTDSRVGSIDRDNDRIIADINDYSAVLAAMTGVDTVIHLAANPEMNQGWEDVYRTGIGGTYHVLAAAHESGVQRVIYASSILVHNWQELSAGVTVKIAQLPQPDTFYGVGKVCGEVLGQMFATRYGMSVICVRIGSFTEGNEIEVKSEYRRRTWCSARDLAQLIIKCLTTDLEGFQIFYVSSDNPRSQMDLTNAYSLLDYQPQDRAESIWEAIYQKIRRQLGKIRRQFIR